MCIPLFINCTYALSELFMIHIEIKPSKKPEANFVSESLVKQLVCGF